MAQSKTRNSPSGSATKSAKRRSQPRGRQGARTVRVGPRGQKKRLKQLAALAISMETFAEEVQRNYRKWVSDPPTTKDVRLKYASTMRVLADQGESVLIGCREARFMVHSGGRADDTAVAAFEIVEAMGGEQLLERLIEALRGVARRLEVPFSTETQDKITDGWWAINDLAGQVKQSASALMNRCREKATGFRLPNAVQNAIERLKEPTRLALREMTGSFDETSEVAEDLDRRMDAMVKRAAGVHKALGGLKTSLKVFVDQHLSTTKAHDKSLAYEIAGTLEYVQSLVTQACNLVTFASSRIDAARTPDHAIEADAGELADVVRSMREEHATLQAMIERYREIVARAPYKHFTRTKPLPEWGDLGEQERELTEVLVDLRNSDPDDEYYAVTQAMIETKMGHKAGGKPSVTVLRWLNHLEDEHQIVGIYAPPPNAHQQQKTNMFWINEDAYAKYRRIVLKPNRD